MELVDIIKAMQSPDSYLAYMILAGFTALHNSVLFNVTHSWPVTVTFSWLNESWGIYTIDQYRELFKHNSTWDRFTICYIQTDDILSFKTQWPMYYKKLVNSDETSGWGIR